MMIRNDEPFKSLSVIDDLAQSLLPEDHEAEQSDNDFDLGFTPGGYVNGFVPLERVERPGRAIRTLRGVAPVAVAARRRDPLVIPLADATGRSYRSGESVLTIRAVRRIHLDPKITIEPADIEGKREKPAPPPQATEIELSVRPIAQSGGTTCGPDLSEHQFEVVDADGQVWGLSPWWLSGTEPERQDGETRVRLIPVDENLIPWSGDLAGAKLRYYDMTVAKVDVPFEFTDIPLP